MRAAGVTEFGGLVRSLELADRKLLDDDEVSVQVCSAGVGNWDELSRRGRWDLGRQPPMALGTEASGMIRDVGAAVSGLAVGDLVMTHSLPLRHEGAWSERFIAAARDVAVLPPAVRLDIAAAFPIPALTADQTLHDALGVQAGDVLLVHGAGGVTGSLLVQLAAHLGAKVIATTGGHRAEQATLQAQVVDHRSPDWPQQVLAATGGRGVDHAVNAVPGGEQDALAAVRDGGRLATLTGGGLYSQREITFTAVQVRPDGPRLAGLCELLAAQILAISVGASYDLDDAPAALAHVLARSHGSAVVLHISQPDPLLHRSRLESGTRPSS